MSVQMSSFFIINLTFLSTTFSDTFDDWFTEVCYPLTIERSMLIDSYLFYLCISFYQHAPLPEPLQYFQFSGVKKTVSLKVLTEFLSNAFTIAVEYLQ